MPQKDREYLVEERSNNYRNIKKILVVVTVLTAVVSLAAIVYIYFTFPVENVEKIEQRFERVEIVKKKKKKEDKTGWDRVADYFDKAIDPEVDPCDNFFMYACGKYQKRRKAPSLSELVQKLSSDLKKALANLEVTNSSARAIQQVKIIYDKCVHERATVNSTALMPYLDLLGGFPLVFQNLSRNDWDPYHLAGVLMSFNLATLFQPLIEPDWGDPDWGKIIFFEQGATLIPLVYYEAGMADQKKTEMRQVIVLIAKFLAGKFDLPPLDENQLQNDIDMMLIIDQHIAYGGDKGFRSRKTQGESYNIFNITTAKEKWPFVNWEEYLTALAGDNVDPKAVLNRKFSIMLPKYVKVLDDLPVRPGVGAQHMQNYLAYRFMIAMLQMIPRMEEVYVFHKNMHLEAAGLPKLTADRESICTDLINTHLQYATSRVYVDYSWLTEPGKPRDLVTSMTGYVLNGFETILDRLPWMTDDSKEGAYGKISNLQQNMAYPEWIMNNDFLDAEHPIERLNVQEETPIFEMLVELFRFGAWYTWHDLLMPVDRARFGMPVTVVNAWYSASLNSINLPACFLHEPVFDVEFPMAFNFGALGAVLGHELGHAFDNKGSEFDGSGKLDNWMDKNSTRGYKLMEQCLVQQYDGSCYPDYDICVDGQFTLGENLADNAGLISTYEAYKSYVAAKGPEEHLPGQWSNLTMDQVFFMSFGHLWCSNQRTDPTLQIYTDNHSPDKWRIINTLKDYPVFAETFKCKAGSGMAPEDRCDGWWPDV